MRQPRRVVVGVDAGGSSVAAAACRRDGAIAYGSATGANATTHGIDVTADAIAAAVRQAAGSDDDVAALYVGAAGAGRSASAQQLAHALRYRFPSLSGVRVEDDARIALRAAIAEGPGVAIIAGTGSVAYAENGDTRLRLGGAGYLLGDEGSGFAIGMAAIRFLVRAYDGRAPMDETAGLVERTLDVASRDALLDEMYAQQRDGVPNIRRIASLASGVVALAARGNRSSVAIVDGAAAELAELCADAAAQAGLHSPRIALGGGLLRDENALSQALHARLKKRLHAATMFSPSVPPEIAALTLARHELMPTILV